MNILVIDGQGGRMGKMLIDAIRKKFKDAEIIAVGTNATATATMLKGGADEGATGENPVVVASRKADVIVGPLGIVIADSLLGEVTEKMALAVARSNAKRVLIPMNRCDNLVAGLSEISMTEILQDVLVRVKTIYEERT